MFHQFRVYQNHRHGRGLASTINKSIFGARELVQSVFITIANIEQAHQLIINMSPKMPQKS